MQKVYVLKVKYVYDDEFETCGVFTSMSDMNKGKHEYLKKKREEGYDTREFSFIHSVMELDKIYA